MAAMFTKQRFADVTENNIEQLKNGSKNRNTNRSTSFWLNVWKTWCEEKEIYGDIEKFPPSELNILLEKFYAEVKTKNGDDYEPDSLRVMLAAIDRHLKDKSYPLSIIRDREFTSSKQVLEGKAKLLREAGRGKRPNKSRPLTKEEEETLWRNGKLGSQTPQALVNTIWWLLTQQFGLRGRQEHHSMRMEDFHIGRDDNLLEFVEFFEGPTKTRPGGLSAKKRDFQPKMFATGGDRCPVALFKQFKSHRPIQLQNSGPFYLSVNHNRKSASNPVWYKVQPMGVNKINEMMKNIIEGTSLENSDKKFTNHSARKTLACKMKKANVERAGIVKVTGHRSVQSLDDYDEADEEEQRDLSWAISSRNNNASMNGSSSASRPLSVSSVTSHQEQQQAACSSQVPPVKLQSMAGLSYNNTALSMSPMMGSQTHNLMNTFNNCQVSFNFLDKSISSQPPVSSVPRKRRVCIFESDSDTE